MLLLISVALFGAFASKNVNADCAYGGNMPPNEWSPATTTRYWDCCKMSCSWDKTSSVPYLQSHAKSCMHDGFTEGQHYDTSICESGSNPSASCNDFQPWWDPDYPDLLFMFAAFQNGDADCCSCAEITGLSDGNLAGKTIIVQITNCGTGAELGVGHFDLQIPMSGVGIFTEGCPRQWGYDINFGIQFGGISDVSECEQLYEKDNPLYFGCLFRFLSFMGSDNPSGQYRRVQCPEVYNKLSGCSRSDDHCFPTLDYAVPTERMPYADSDKKPLPKSAYGTGGGSEPENPGKSGSSRILPALGCVWPSLILLFYFGNAY